MIGPYVAAVCSWMRLAVQRRQELPPCEATPRRISALQLPFAVERRGEPVSGMLDFCLGGKYKPHMQLRGKVAVITGASMGIGEALARLLVARGATVVLSSRDLSRVEAARQRIGTPERTTAIACDVCRRSQLDALVRETVIRHGRIDLWVNNAGFGLVDSVEKMDMGECRRMFDTNLFAVIEAMQAVIPQMKRQGGGAIVNVSSVAGHIAVPYMSAYGATKHALNCITKAARLELRASGIQVTNVCPGYVKTSFSDNAVRGTDDLGVPGSVKHGITPDRVARAVLNAYAQRKREIVVPWRDRVTIGLYRWLPGLFEAGMLRLMKPRTPSQ